MRRASPAAAFTTERDELLAAGEIFAWGVQGRRQLSVGKHSPIVWATSRGPYRALAACRAPRVLGGMQWRSPCARRRPAFMQHSGHQPVCAWHHGGAASKIGGSSWQLRQQFQGIDSPPSRCHAAKDLFPRWIAGRALGSCRHAACNGLRSSVSDPGCARPVTTYAYKTITRQTSCIWSIYGINWRSFFLRGLSGLRVDPHRSRVAPPPGVARWSSRSCFNFKNKRTSICLEY